MAQQAAVADVEGEFKLGPLDNLVPASYLVATFVVGASAGVVVDAMADSMMQTIGERVRALHGRMPELFGTLFVFPDGRGVIRKISSPELETTRWLERVAEVMDATAIMQNHNLDAPPDATGEVAAPVFRCIVAPRAGGEEVLVLISMSHKFGDIQVFGRLCRCLLQGELPTAVPGPRASAPPAHGPLSPPPAGLSYAPAPPCAPAPPPAPAPPTPQPAEQPAPACAKGLASVILMALEAPFKAMGIALPGTCVCQRLSVPGFSPGEGKGETHGMGEGALTTHDAVTARLWRATVTLDLRP